MSLEKVYQAVMEGDAGEAASQVEAALAAGVPAGCRGERPFAGWQIDPLPVGRYAETMGFEYVFPAPRKHVVIHARNDLAGVRVDDREARECDAAEQTAVTRSFGRYENRWMFFRIPCIRSARIEVVLQRDPNLFCPFIFPRRFLLGGRHFRSCRISSSGNQTGR